MTVKVKYKLMLWLLAISVAINLSAGVTYLYHKQMNKNQQADNEKEEIELPAMQRTRFFREQLGLKPAQTDVFRELNRDFNQEAWHINRKLEELRIEMITEMGSNEPNSEKLEKIADEIGVLHSRLKNETISFYMNMKKECNAEQQAKLYEIFISVLEKNENVRLPQGIRRGRNARQ